MPIFRIEVRRTREEEGVFFVEAEDREHLQEPEVAESLEEYIAEFDCWSDTGDDDTEIHSIREVGDPGYGISDDLRYARATDDAPRIEPPDPRQMRLFE